MQAGPKPTKYFCPPGSIPKNGQKVWDLEQDRQLILLHSIFGGLDTSISREKFFENGRQFKKIWNIHLKTGKSVEEILKLN